MESINTRHSAQVLIDGRIYNLSGTDDEMYLQNVAVYLNDKIQELKKTPGFGRLKEDYKVVAVELNIADDYFKERQRCEILSARKEILEKDAYSLKHEAVTCQMALEEAKAQMDVLKAEAKAREKEAEQLKKTIEELNASIEELNASAEELKTSLEEQKKARDEAEAKTAELLAEKDAAEQKAASRTPIQAENLQAIPVQTAGEPSLQPAQQHLPERPPVYSNDKRQEQYRAISAASNALSHSHGKKYR